MLGRGRQEDRSRELLSGTGSVAGENLVACLGSTSEDLFSSPAEILLVAHRIHPGDFAADRQRDPGEPFLRRRAMPVRDVGREVYRFSRSEISDRLTLDLNATSPLLYQQHEAAVVDMPVGARAGFVPKPDTADVRRVDTGDGASEIRHLRRLFRARGRT